MNLVKKNWYFLFNILINCSDLYSITSFTYKSALKLQIQKYKQNIKFCNSIELLYSLAFTELSLFIRTKSYRITDKIKVRYFKSIEKLNTFYLQKLKLALIWKLKVNTVDIFYRIKKELTFKI